MQSSFGLTRAAIAPPSSGPGFGCSGCCNATSPSGRLGVAQGSPNFSIRPAPTGLGPGPLAVSGAPKPTFASDSLDRTEPGSPRSEAISDSFKGKGPLGSCSTTSVGSTSALGGRQQAGYERRLSWLEEDVQMLQRRLRDEVGDPLSAGTGDSGLRQLVARLDGELAAERREREDVQERLTALEQALTRETTERESRLHGFSKELQTTMQALIGRIDESLFKSASTMREKQEATESRLRSLIQRVDKGLTEGVASLKDTIESQSDVAAMVPASLPSSVMMSTRQTLSEEPLGSGRAPPAGLNRLGSSLGAGSAEPVGRSALRSNDYSLATSRASPLASGRTSPVSDAPSSIMQNSVRDTLISHTNAVKEQLLSSLSGGSKTQEQLLSSWDQMRQDQLRLREECSISSRQRHDATDVLSPSRDIQRSNSGASLPGHRQPGLTQFASRGQPTASPGFSGISRDAPLGSRGSQASFAGSRGVARSPSSGQACTLQVPGSGLTTSMRPNDLSTPGGPSPMLNRPRSPGA